MASHGRLLNLGLTTYQDAYEVQLQLHEARAADRIKDVLVLTEHLPIYTLGRTTRPEHVGAGWEAKSINGIPLCMSDRGGSVTYHGPGQIVGYPILALRHYCAGPKAYIRLLEESLIRSLAMLGIKGSRRHGTPGVWVKDHKIGAVGVRISSGVTLHGFALNVVNTLEPFSAVLPCGLVGCGVTSVARESDRQVTLPDGRVAVVRGFQEVFDLSFEESFSMADIGMNGAGTALQSCILS
jgi:lipoyl(octanoyl) transferase